MKWPVHNFRMTGYQAAMGLAQLQKIESIIDGKRRMASLYKKHLGAFPGLRLPVEESWAKNVYWMYAVLVTLVGMPAGCVDQSLDE